MFYCLNLSIMKIIKITEKEFPIVVDDGYGNAVETAYEYTLFFDDGSQLTRNSLLCEDKWLEEGQEVYVYGDLISRRPLTDQDVFKHQFLNLLLWGVVIAAFAALVWFVLA